MGEATLAQSMKTMGAGIGIALLGLLPALRSPHTDVKAVGWGLVIIGAALAVLSVLTAVYDHYNRD